MQRSAEQTKNKLMTAALRLFGETGYDGVSVRQICELAGVNISMINYFYGDKLGLYRSCLRETLSNQETIQLVGKLRCTESAKNIHLKTDNTDEYMFTPNQDINKQKQVLDPVRQFISSGVLLFSGRPYAAKLFAKEFTLDNLNHPKEQHEQILFLYTQTREALNDWALDRELVLKISSSHLAYRLLKEILEISLVSLEMLSVLQYQSIAQAQSDLISLSEQGVALSIENGKKQSAQNYLVL